MLLWLISIPDIDGITLAQQLAHDYPALSRIGFSAVVIDETLSQRTSTLFLGIIQNHPRDELVDLRIICTVVRSPACIRK